MNKILRWAIICVVASLWAVPAGAHTDSDFVAVPAGSATTVTFKPTHGCGDSPTVEVSLRAPIEGAAAGDAAGWTATAEPDGNGGTVLTWTGGSLPAHETGAFPVEFTAPDSVGELLTFPAVQVCENGEELAWISGDPASDFPAPRLLVLPAGTAAATTLDEVPADAPGREQLVEVVDVDNPTADAPTTSETPDSTNPDSTNPDSTSTTSPATAEDDASDQDDSRDADTAASDDADDSGGVPAIVWIVVAVVVIAAAAVVGFRRFGSGANTPRGE